MVVYPCFFVWVLYTLVFNETLILKRLIDNVSLIIIGTDIALFNYGLRIAINLG